MDILFVMDPISYIKPEKDTSYHMILAAGDRQHRVAVCQAKDLFLKHNQLWGHVDYISLPESHGNALRVEKSETVQVDMFQAVFIRSDPPFDRRYFYLTLLTEFLPPSTKVINNPQTLRDWNEKLAALKFPQFSPPTLVARTVADILDFQRDQNATLILKPVDGFGGRGIFFLPPDDRNREAIVHSISHGESHWILAQTYLPVADKGDKRILLLNGEPMGAILRVHAEGKELNNLDAGGSAHPCELSQRDREICETLKPWLIEKGILLAGIDIIGDYLIEINITSPTGIQQMSRFKKHNLSLDVIQAVEKMF